MYKFRRLFYWISVCISMHCSASLGAEQNLTLQLELDSLNVLVGEPISGQVELWNNDVSSISVGYEGGYLFSNMWFNFGTSEGDFTVMPYRVEGCMVNSRSISSVVIASDNKVQDLLFVQAYDRGPDGAESTEYGTRTFIAGTSNTVMDVWVTIDLFMEGGEKFRLESNLVQINVGNEGEGFSSYVGEFGTSTLTRPLQLCPIVDVSNLEYLGDYAPVMRKVVAYQYGERASTLLYLRRADKYRTPEQVYSYITGGLVDEKSELKITKWRHAMLYLYEQVYGKPQKGIPIELENAAKFVDSIPIGQP